MSIILGFGSTEDSDRLQIRNELLTALQAKQTIKVVLKKWNDKADNYDALPMSEAPERYTRFWVYDSKIVFHHINRRHPFSPDGWALLKIEEPFKL